MLTVRKAALMIFAAWALSAVSLVCAAKSAHAAAPTPAAGRELPPLREAIGKLQRVDVRQSAVVVDGTWLKVDQTTTIFVEGRTGTLGDLAEGEIVRAAYETGSVSPIAQWIERAVERR